MAEEEDDFIRANQWLSRRRVQNSRVYTVALTLAIVYLCVISVQANMTTC